MRVRITELGQIELDCIPRDRSSEPHHYCAATLTLGRPQWEALKVFVDAKLAQNPDSS